MHLSWFNSRVGIGLLAAVGVGIFFVGFSSSLWFLRGMWSHVPAQVDFGYRNTSIVADLIRGSGRQIGETIGAATGIDQEIARSVVYLRDESNEYISVIPRFKHQATASQSLASVGWQNIHRIGWILVASKGSDPIKHSALSAVSSQLSAPTWQRLPISPLFFIRSKSANVASYAVLEKDTVHVSSSVDSLEFPVEKNRDSSRQELVGSNKLIVSIPRYFLDIMHQDFRNSISTAVVKKLHFEKTTPEVTSLFPGAENMYISIDQGDIALGVRTKGDAFGVNLVTAMNKEQGQRHPRKKAFTLPDRSLGYEYVRGVAKAHFSPKEGSSTCLPSQDYDEVLFLCGKQDAAVIASSEHVGSDLLRFMQSSPSQWGGQVEGDYTIFFSGSDKNIDVWITEKKNQ